MPTLVHELITLSAQKLPEAVAIQVKEFQLNYAQLSNNISEVAGAFLSMGVEKNDRIGIFLTKSCENVEAMFASSQAGAVFVPINPVLKAPQVKHIINDCMISVLITNIARFKALLPFLPELTSIKQIILTDLTSSNDSTITEALALTSSLDLAVHTWSHLESNKHKRKEFTSDIKPTDLAAILYTSGSTGKPKGIMLSHQNIVLGAKSVSEYLDMSCQDKVLALLPLSFDYGLNQLTSSFLVGAHCVLFDYLFANDVVKAIETYQITGIAGVPPLWAQLLKSNWGIRLNSLLYQLRWYTFR